MTEIQQQFKTYINEVTPFEWRTGDWKDIPVNFLYDFFDSIGINVYTPLIAYKRRCDFGAQVAGSINDENTDIWNYLNYEVGWVKFKYNANDIADNFFPFATRKEAEIAAFTKAFELAETIID